MSDQVLCAICQTPILPEEARVACPSCNAEYHAECWNENGGCAIYGCSQVPEVEHRRSIEIPVSYWGQENKPCPSCGREILAAAVRCRHCGATFASAQPQDADQFQARTALEAELPKMKKTVVWLFVFSVLPCTAPIGGIAALIWYSSRRNEVAALPALYPALSKIGIGVGLGQTVLLVLMAILYSVTRTAT
jgi:Prokaryotic RING finger family 1